MSTKFEVKLRCRVCSHRYKRILNSADEPDPPCPRCLKAERTRGMDFDRNRAPAAIGQNVQVRAIDETAKVTMEMYGMTDLRSDVRPGETAAPKLPPKQQEAADNFFVGRKSIKGPMRTIAARAAMNAFSGNATAVASAQGARNPIELVHKAKIRPDVRFVAGDGVSKRG